MLRQVEHVSVCMRAGLDIGLIGTKSQSGYRAGLEARQSTPIPLGSFHLTCAGSQQQSWIRVNLEVIHVLASNVALICPKVYTAW